MNEEDAVLIAWLRHPKVDGLATMPGLAADRLEALTARVKELEDDNHPNYRRLLHEQVEEDRETYARLVKVEATLAKVRDSFGGSAEIALGIEDGLRELSAELIGCTPSMLVLAIQKRIARSRAILDGNGGDTE